MKKYNHPIDDLFRETLKDHQMKPSEAAKKAFLQDAMQISQPEKKGRTGLILLSGIFVLISAGLLIWAITSEKFSSNAGKKVTPATRQVHSAGLNTHHPLNQTQSTGISKQNKTLNSSVPISNQQPVTGESTQFSNPVPAFGKNSEKQKPSANPIMPDKKNEMTKSSSLSAISGGGLAVANPGNVSTPGNDVKKPDSTMEAEINLPASVIMPDVSAPDSTLPQTSDSVQIPAPAIKNKSSEAAGNSSKWIPAIGVYYTPEWMFNTLEGTKFVNNFGVEGTFHFGKFSIRTGAGVSIGKGTNEVVVEYNDFLGAYNHLDSMNFKWDDPTHSYVPSMYLSKKDVWDSLMKLDYAKVVKRYTYLQIPMIIGYDFWQTERISMGFRVGPVLSVLLVSKQLSDEYDPGTKRIISVNDIAPEQVSLNWQVMGGINTAFKLSEALFFELEPNVRYYFNSVYEKPVNNTKPWSAGVRAAFVIHF